MSVTNSWVRRLKPSDPSGDLEPACFPETWNRAVAAIGVGPAQWVVEFARELGVLAVGPDVSPARLREAAEKARPSAEAVVLNALVALDAGVPAPTAVPPEMAERVTSTVSQRIPLSQVLVYEHISHARVSEVLVSAFRSLVPADEQAEQFAELSRFLVDFVSGFAMASSAAYTEAERAWLESADGSRGELVRALLRGEHPDPHLSRRLSYELAHRTHLGLVVVDTRRDPSDLGRIAADALSRMGAAHHIVLPSDDNEVWAWGEFITPEIDTSALRDLVPAPVRLAVGRPAGGVDGFRTTHEDAMTAARMMRLDRRPDDDRRRVVLFADVQMAALLTTDLRAAARFVRDELGRLGGPKEALLRETVRVYLENNCSPAAAAASLNVVKNTIVYRVRRAEELLDRSVKERQGVLWAALHLAEILDPDVLDSVDPGNH